MDYSAQFQAIVEARSYSTELREQLEKELRCHVTKRLEEKLAELFDENGKSGSVWFTARHNYTLWVMSGYYYRYCCATGDLPRDLRTNMPIEAYQELADTWRYVIPNRRFFWHRKNEFWLKSAQYWFQLAQSKSQVPRYMGQLIQFWRRPSCYWELECRELPVEFWGKLNEDGPCSSDDPFNEDSEMYWKECLDFKPPTIEFVEQPLEFGLNPTHLIQRFLYVEQPEFGLRSIPFELLPEDEATDRFSAKYTEYWPEPRQFMAHLVYDLSSNQLICEQFSLQPVSVHSDEFCSEWTQAWRSLLQLNAPFVSQQDIAQQYATSQTALEQLAVGEAACQTALQLAAAEAACLAALEQLAVEQAANEQQIKFWLECAQYWPRPMLHLMQPVATEQAAVGQVAGEPAAVGQVAAEQAAAEKPTGKRPLSKMPEVPDWFDDEWFTYWDNHYPGTKPKPGSDESD